MSELIFLHAERIVYNLADSFQNKWNWEKLGVIAFRNAIITSQTFKILFVSDTKEIVLNLNLHPLEMPWSIEVLILNGNETIRLNSLVKPKEKQEVVYEVNHELLNDPNGLGDELAKEIAEDLLNYLIKAV
jgi:hypothetical protein